MNIKLNFSLILLLFCLTSNSQVNNIKFTEDISISKSNNLIDNNLRQLPPFWTSDFSNPQDWLIDNSNQLAPNGWNIGSTVNSWYNGITGIQSSSGGNFAELYNGDPTVNPSTQMLNVTYRMTTRSPIDVTSLVGTDQVTLSWEETGARFNDLQEVQISTDGITFTKVADNLSYSVLSQSGGSMYSNPERRTVNIQPYISNNPSSVWIRYEWTTNYPNQSTNPNVWITYGWIIDDVSLSVTPDYVLQAVDANHGGWEVGYASTTGLGMDYTFKPLTQSASNPYMFELKLANLGAKNLNGTKMNVTVKNSLGSQVFSSSSDTATISVLDTVTLLANQTFDPASVGAYNINFWGSSNSILSTDTIQMQAIITDSVYGRDYNSADGNWRVARNCGGLELLNIFDIYTSEQVSSVSANIADYSVPGTPVFAKLYEVDTTQSPWTFLQIAQTDDYVLQAQDLNSWINIPFKPAYPISPSVTGPYAISIGGYAHPVDTFGVNTSGEAEILMSRIQDNGCDLGTQAFGYWYYITSTPMIRMNFGSTWPSSILSDKEMGIKVFPNPTATNKIHIELGRALMGKSDIKLFDVTGRLVAEKNINNVKSTFINVKNIQKGNYILEISNKYNSTKEKILIK